MLGEEAHARCAGRSAQGAPAVVAGHVVGAAKPTNARDITTGRRRRLGAADRRGRCVPGFERNATISTLAILPLNSCQLPSSLPDKRLRTCAAAQCSSSFTFRQAPGLAGHRQSVLVERRIIGNRHLQRLAIPATSRPMPPASTIRRRVRAPRNASLSSPIGRAIHARQARFAQQALPAGRRNARHSAAGRSGINPASIGSRRQVGSADPPGQPRRAGAAQSPRLAAEAWRSLGTGRPFGLLAPPRRRITDTTRHPGAGRTPARPRAKSRRVRRSSGDPGTFITRKYLPAVQTTANTRDYADGPRLQAS